MSTREPQSSPTLPTPYSVKRHGVTITNCDSEPIHTPGCIQPNGVLLALSPRDRRIVQVSENSREWLGRRPQELLGSPVSAVFAKDDSERLHGFLDNEPIERNPLFAFTATIAATRKQLDVTVHRADGVEIVELEPAGRPERDTVECFSLVKRVTARLQAAPTVAAFCQVAADEIFQMTGLDRVMIYRFLPDGAGEVFAEAKRDDLHGWRGQRYPASDIPAPARAIFRRIGVRPVPDARAEMMEMVPLTNPETGRPLDMTHCILRGASVMYTEYLQNMDVGASLTMPLLRDRELWGLIACHHQTPTAFPYRIRAPAEFLAQVASLQLGNAEQREHMLYRCRIESLHRSLVSRTAKLGGDLETLVTGEPNLAQGIECHAVALRHRGEWVMVGRTPTVAQLDDLADWLRGTPEFNDPDRPVFATEALASQFSPAADYAELASGLLAIPLSHQRHALIMWFRPEEIQTIRWGGNPHKPYMTTGPHGERLTPRKSFEIWQEQARQRAVPWKPVEVEAALELRYWLMEIVVSGAEQLVEINAELARSNAELDAFNYVVSHDLKEPLRSIHKYAHSLIEETKSGGALSERGRERLDKLLCLAIRMDGLLDALLHFSQVGRSEVEYDEVALDEVVGEALEMLGGRMWGANVDIRVPRPLPRIRCDRVRVREIFANLISNALKYNDKPNPWIEIGYIEPGDAPEFLRAELVPPEAAGQTIFYVRDNGLGIEAKHYQQVFKMFKRLHAREAFGGGAGAGLTITKKLVEQHRGRIWLDSILGEGTTFFFTLGHAAQ